MWFPGTHNQLFLGEKELEMHRVPRAGSGFGDWLIEWRYCIFGQEEYLQGQKLDKLQIADVGLWAGAAFGAKNLFQQ